MPNFEVSQVIPAPVIVDRLARDLVAAGLPGISVRLHLDERTLTTLSGSSGLGQLQTFGSSFTPKGHIAAWRLQGDRLRHDLEQSQRGRWTRLSRPPTVKSCIHRARTFVSNNFMYTLAGIIRRTIAGVLDLGPRSEFGGAAGRDEENCWPQSAPRPLVARGAPATASGLSAAA